METQLVRLDKPYNIICNSKGEFALHIATLMVITEEKISDRMGRRIGTRPVTRCYPVVGNSYKMDGEVWMDKEQEKCLTVCREGCNITTYTLKKVMEYCAKNNVFLYTKRIPYMLSSVLINSNCEIKLPQDNNGTTISDYEVCLIFEEGNQGRTCMVYADNDSVFYFYDYFANDPELFKDLPTSLQVVERFTDLRNSYIQILNVEGLNSIKFTTKHDDYKWFVDNLNSCKVD